MRTAQNSSGHSGRHTGLAANINADSKRMLLGWAGDVVGRKEEEDRDSGAYWLLLLAWFWWASVFDGWLVFVFPSRGGTRCSKYICMFLSFSLRGDVFGSTH